MSTMGAIDGKLTTPKYDLLSSKEEGGEVGGGVRLTYEYNGDFGRHGCERVSGED